MLRRVMPVRPLAEARVMEVIEAPKLHRTVRWIGTIDDAGLRGPDGEQRREQNDEQDSEDLHWVADPCIEGTDMRATRTDPGVPIVLR